MEMEIQNDVIINLTRVVMPRKLHLQPLSKLREM